MVRLRSSVTGSVVNVDDVTAARLGEEWVPVVVASEPVAPEPAEKKKPTRRRASSARTD